MKDITREIMLLSELRQQEDKAETEHNDLELIGLYDSVVRLVKSILTTIISTYGSGTIAGIIGSTKYAEIDKAINKALSYLFHAEPEELHDLETDNASIADLIRTCYKQKDI